MEDACGPGPEGQQLSEKWYISLEDQDEHYFIQFKDVKKCGSPQVLMSKTASAMELRNRTGGRMFSAGYPSYQGIQEASLEENMGFKFVMAVFCIAPRLQTDDSVFR
jgi:hypothetical protein